MTLFGPDPGDENDYPIGRFHPRYVDVLWTHMPMCCWGCGHKWLARVCMADYETSCPECGAQVAIPLPKEPRRHTR